MRLFLVGLMLVGLIGCSKPTPPAKKPVDDKKPVPAKTDEKKACDKCKKDPCECKTEEKKPTEDEKKPTEGETK